MLCLIHAFEFAIVRYKQVVCSSLGPCSLVFGLARLTVISIIATFGEKVTRATRRKSVS